MQRNSCVSSSSLPQAPLCKANDLEGPYRVSPDSFVCAVFVSVQLAWTGLLSTVLPNGTVTQVCCGTGIQPSVQAYYDRPTSYTCSGPGGAGAVLYAAVDLAKGY
jgi:hypothetical protein